MTFPTTGSACGTVHPPVAVFARPAGGLDHAVQRDMFDDPDLSRLFPSMPNRRTRLDNLLKIAIEAHGGLNAWNQFESLRASVSSGGAGISPSLVVSSHSLC